MMIISSAVLLILLVSSHFSNSIAWIGEKESMKMISAEDYPINGPWIVSVGRFKNAFNIYR